MVKGIKQHLQRHKSVIESFLSLSVLNVLNMLLPLITIPYLYRVVGVDRYGAYSFVYAIVMYLILFSSYGFNFSATRQIARHRDDPEAVNRIYNSVLQCRLALALFASFLVWLALALFAERETSLMLFYGLGIVLGDVFIPVWLFQGMEKMRYITLVNVVSKLLFTGLTFLLVKTPSDYVYVILFNSLGYMAAGIVSTYIACRMFGISIRRISKSDWIYQMRDGLHVFLSTLFMNLYRNSNILLLGACGLSDTSLGYYSGAEKIVKAVEGMVQPLSQALFPHLGYRFKNHSNSENIRSLFRLSLYLLGLLALLTVVFYVSVPWITWIVMHVHSVEAENLMRIMSAVIMFGGINYVLGIVGLINLGEQKRFLYNVCCSGLLSILFLLATVHSLGSMAAGFSMLLSELLLFALCVYSLWRLYQNARNA